MTCFHAVRILSVVLAASTLGLGTAALAAQKPVT
jgi:hypothetical protein